MIKIRFEQAIQYLDKKQYRFCCNFFYKVKCFSWVCIMNKSEHDLDF